MAFGRFDYELNPRRRMWVGILKWTAGFVAFSSVALFSYQFAIERMKTREVKREKEVQVLGQQIAELQTGLAQSQQTARQAESRIHELEARLAKDVPTGNRARLLQFVDERLAAGVTFDRLALVLAHTRMPTNCANTDTKRLTVSGPHMRTSGRVTSFANGNINITAEGETLRERAGETSFDPARPVTIKIAFNSGTKEAAVVGILPLKHSLVLNNKELRFTFTAGSRSTIEAAVESCEFP